MNFRMIFAVSFLVMMFAAGILRAEPVMIVNPSVEESVISKGDVKRIFLGTKKQWDNGKKINVAVLKAGDAHEIFIGNYVEKSAASFASYWKRAIVTGTGIPPRNFESEKELVQYVSETEGAVGYVSELADVKNVKTITVK